MKKLPKKLFNGCFSLAIHIGDNPEMDKMIQKLLINRGYSWSSTTGVTDKGRLHYKEVYAIRVSSLDGILTYSTKGFFEGLHDTYVYQSVSEFIKALEEHSNTKTIKTSYGSYILTDAVLTNKLTDEKYYTLDIIQAFKIVKAYDIAGTLLVGEHKMYAGDVKELYEALQTSNAKHQVNKLYINEKG